MNAVEYDYESALKLGLGTRFLSMRRVIQGDKAVAFFMYPIRPGEPGYAEARFEITEIPDKEMSGAEHAEHLQAMRHAEADHLAPAPKP